MLIFDQLRKNDRQLQVLAISVLSGLGLLFLGLWYVQVVSARRYQASQISQSFRTVRIPAVRGKILDANGVAFAENRPSYNINLYLDELRPQFQSAYSNNYAWVMRQLVRTNSRAKLSRSQRIELGKLTRYQVVSNLVFRVSSLLQQPVQLQDKKFFEHYDQRLFVPMPVLTNLNPTQIALFAEQTANLPGFDLEVQPVRVYPFRTSAAHLIGHLQRDDSAEDEEVFFNYRMPDFKGVVGIEGAFDEQLRGRTGIKSVLVNSLGYRQTENTWNPAEAGQNVYLTIDRGIQQAAEQALRSAPVPYTGPVRGAAVVMHARTGDLIAVASNPSYDPNEFVPRLLSEKAEYLQDPVLTPQINRATYGLYAPGSVFKIVVGLAALEAGLDPKEKIHNPPDPSDPAHGHIVMGRRKVRDLAPPGDYDFRRALMKSCNTYFITNGLRCGIEGIVRLGHRLHLGERAGIPTWQDAPGVLPTRDWLQENRGGAWFDGDTANLCIGQGDIAVTPLQVAVMIAAVANGGKVLWPRLISRTEPQEPFSDSPPVNFPPGRIRDELKVSRRSLEIVRDAMLADVEDAEGTGTRAFVPGMRICAKTGTAQIKQGNRIVGHTTWFASFAPFQDPRYAVVVMIEDGTTGGATCAPVAQQIYLALQKREQRPKPETLASR